jgi:hypothetical protein
MSSTTGGSCDSDLHHRTRRRAPDLDGDGRPSRHDTEAQGLRAGRHRRHRVHLPAPLHLATEPVRPEPAPATFVTEVP